MEKFVSFGMREEIIECDINIDYKGFLSKIQEMFDLKEDFFSVEDLTEDNFLETITDKESFKVIKSEKRALEILGGKISFVSINTIKEVKAFLLLYGFKVDGYGKTPLHWAATHGDLEIIKLLVENNFENTYECDGWGWSPLHWAVFNNRIRVVKFLLEQNFDNALYPNKKGETPLNLAVFRGNVEIVKLLLSKNFDNAHQLDDVGRSPLSWAIINRNAKIVKLLEDDIKRRKQ